MLTTDSLVTTHTRAVFSSSQASQSQFNHYCSTMWNETQVCVTVSRRMAFEVPFHSSAERWKAHTPVICGSVVRSEEKIFVNCWHNKINFPSINFFSSLLWALMQCYWLAQLKCQLAFLIINFSLNVISNCYCQTRDCNLVFEKENPFLISSPVLPPFGHEWIFNSNILQCAVSNKMGGYQCIMPVSFILIQYGSLPPRNCLFRGFLRIHLLTILTIKYSSSVLEEKKVNACIHANFFMDIK